MKTPIPLRDGCFYLSGSAVEAFCKCPRLYYYSNVLRRETSEVKVGMTYGKIIHKALAVEPAFRRSVLETEFMSVDGISCGIPLDDFRQLDYATAQIAAYEKKYPTEPFTVAQLASGKQAMEIAFTEPLFDIEFGSQKIPVIWTGVIDKMIKWQDGTLEHLDHKTTSIGGQSFWDEYYNGFAQIGYTWALRNMGHESKGFLIDVLIGRRPTKTGVAHEFMRQRFTVDDRMLLEWKANIANIVKHMFYCFHDEFPYYRNSCSSKYGRCSFFELDAYPADVRDKLIAGDMFRDRGKSPVQEDV